MRLVASMGVLLIGELSGEAACRGRRISWTCSMWGGVVGVHGRSFAMRFTGREREVVAGLLVGLEWCKVAHVAHTAGESIGDEVGVVKPGFASALSVGNACTAMRTRAIVCVALGASADSET